MRINNNQWGLVGIDYRVNTPLLARRMYDYIDTHQNLVTVPVSVISSNIPGFYNGANDGP